MLRKLNEVVYAPYTPNELGIVREIIDSIYVEVEWVKGKNAGKTEKLEYYKVKSYLDLIEDHERKAKNHRDAYNDVVAKI